MKFALTAVLLGSALLGLAACGSTAVNVNSTANSGRNAANSAANSAATAANSVANTVGNAVNSIGNAASAMTTDSPDDFMATAARSGMAEVEMGKLAAQKAADPEVKKFGQMMVDEHTKANEELKSIAGKKNVALPTDLGPHQSSLNELQNQTGKGFDDVYVRLMMSAHQNDVSAFDAQAQHSADPDVKAFAAKQLPVLRKHLESIQNISSRMNKQQGQ